MTYFIDSFEAELHNYLQIWRYMSVEKFLNILDSGCLYMPTAHAYESEDFNEGRFNQSYTAVVRRYLEQYDFEDADLTFEEELKLQLAQVMSARETSYISCWTTREYEDPDMWRVFGGNHTGVVLRTHIANVCEQFYEYQDAEPQMDIIMGKVLYDRQNMGRYLTEEDIVHKFHWPFFFLDGGSQSFSHEREVRFVFHDRDSWGYSRDEILAENPETELNDNEFRDRYLRRDAAMEAKGIEVPFDLRSGVLEIIFGKNMPERTAIELRERLESLGIGNIRVSTI